MVIIGCKIRCTYIFRISDRIELLNLIDSSVMSETPNSAKNSRIDLRVTAEQKTLLEQAASLSGVSLSAYTLLHLIPQAQQDLERQERLMLSNRDRDLFLSTIANPPKLTGKLKTAIAQYQQKYE